MRRLGLLVALVLIVLAAVLAGDSGAPRVAGEPSEPARTFTIAQTTTVAGWQIALSLNSIYVNPASACEYSTPPPGTRRIAADVALSPVGLPCLFTGLQVFSLVDTGDCRYSLRLPDGDPGDSTPGSLSAGGSKRESIPSDVTGTPGLKYSLELVSNGLMGRIAYDRIDNSRPVQI